MQFVMYARRVGQKLHDDNNAVFRDLFILRDIRINK